MAKRMLIQVMWSINMTPEGTPQFSSNLDTSSIHLLIHLLAHTATKPETFNLVVVPKPNMCSCELYCSCSNCYANPVMPA